MELRIKCSSCKFIKPLESFYNDNSPQRKNRYYRSSMCKDCSRSYDKDKYEKQKEKDIDQVLHSRWINNLKKYNLTPDDWQIMYDLQNGLCFICENENVGDRRLAVDHDHKCCPGLGSCGKCIRKLLCVKCNTVVGWLESNPERIEFLLEYVGWSYG